MPLRFSPSDETAKLRHYVSDTLRHITEELKGGFH